MLAGWHCGAGKGDTGQLGGTVVQGKGRQEKGTRGTVVQAQGHMLCAGGGSVCWEEFSICLP